MPIVVESIHSATYQDQQDLQKIYYDAPLQLFSPFTNAQSLIEYGLTDNCLIAARFNDRLLGAAFVQRNNPVWLLSHLCVRKLTRRRGVAERLVVDAGKLARQAGCELRLLAPAPSIEVTALANKLRVPLDVMPPTGFRTGSA
ncbi:MAG TPA: acetyl-CoA sensor PanZ family protein [Pseudomonas sp.]|uniref:acetyl-CoA sensor PanZ family protein n=1 Tax=Pseudomonas sp. TaxID=306 RepID=UPI002ED986EB